MTPEQLERAQAVATHTAELKSLMAAVPREVINGGATRVIAWKHSVSKAQKMLNRSGVDPSKLREAILDLRSVSHADPGALSKAMYG